MTAIRAAIAELEKRLEAVNRRIRELKERAPRAPCRPRSIPQGEA